MVKLLLQDPGAGINYRLSQHAANQNKVDIALLLLNDPRVLTKSVTGGSEMLRSAIEQGQSNIVKLLLRDVRIDIPRIEITDPNVKILVDDEIKRRRAIEETKQRQIYKGKTAFVNISNLTERAKLKRLTNAHFVFCQEMADKELTGISYAWKIRSFFPDYSATSAQGRKFAETSGEMCKLLALARFCNDLSENFELSEIKEITKALFPAQESKINAVKSKEEICSQLGTWLDEKTQNQIEQTRPGSEDLGDLTFSEADICKLLDQASTRVLGRGAIGTTFEFCQFKEKCFALKRFPKDRKAKYEQELPMARFASEHGFGPHVFGTAICDEYPVIVYDKWDITLVDWLKQQPSLSNLLRAREMLSAKVAKMNSIGFRHGDAHMNNVMLKVDADGNMTDITFIDFDRSIISYVSLQQAQDSFLSTNVSRLVSLQHALNEYPLAGIDHEICTRFSSRSFSSKEKDQLKGMNICEEGFPMDHGAFLKRLVT